MKKVIIPLAVLILAFSLLGLVGGTFDLKVTDLGGGRIQVLATNIPSGIAGYCVWESSSNLATWTKVTTNFVNKTWATNTFPTTNLMRFYRAWVY